MARRNPILDCSVSEESTTRTIIALEINGEVCDPNPDDANLRFPQTLTEHDDETNKRIIKSRHETTTEDFTDDNKFAPNCIIIEDDFEIQSDQSDDDFDYELEIETDHGEVCDPNPDDANLRFLQTEHDEAKRIIKSRHETTEDDKFAPYVIIEDDFEIQSESDEDFDYELEIQTDHSDNDCSSDIETEDDFDETQSEIDAYTENITEEDEKLLEGFRPKYPMHHLVTLGEYIIANARPMPKLVNSVIELYKKLGVFLSRYTTGPIPDDFNATLSLKTFESSPNELLIMHAWYLTEPDKWSVASIYEATRLYSFSKIDNTAEYFYDLVLLPRVRTDIQKNKSLHLLMYKSLKMALYYKPYAFSMSVLYTLCASGTCSLREAVIIGSVIKKVCIHDLVLRYALLMLADLKEYCSTISYFMKIILEKECDPDMQLSSDVTILIEHFMEFLNDTRIMPLIWHQSLLAFVQRYNNIGLLKEADKANLRTLLQKHTNPLVTPQIHKELDRKLITVG